MARRQSRRCQGFSLIELLVNMVVLLVVLGTALGAMSGFSKSYGTTMIKADMDSGVRSAAELLTQEIGQAGAMPYALQALGGPVLGGAIAQPVNVGSTAAMYVGQRLMVDVGAAQEPVIIQAILSATQISGVFGQTHGVGVAVDPSGILPQGILSQSTPTQLMLVGDINGDGTLVYVEYDCNPNAAGTGTLTRTITTLPALTQNPPTVLLQNLVTNPNIGNVCFTIPAATAAGGFNFITTVGLTLTTQSLTRDPQSGAFQTMTKSFLNMSPRNILFGLDLAQSNISNRLQATPPGVPVP